MRPDLASIIERVETLRAQTRARADRADEALLEQIEDLLTEGYACALDGDAWSMRSERLHELISDSGSPVRGRELRKLASEHARFQREIVALRRELAELRHDRDRLRAGPRAASA